MFTRRLSGLWGIVSFTIMTIVVIGFLVLLELPFYVILGGSLFAGGLLLLQVISARRGTAQRSQEFSTFEHNSLGDPVTEEFAPPYHRALPFDASESALVWCAPVMQLMSGLGDLFKPGTWGFLGKGKTTNAENALVLTHRRLLFLMIGPDALKQFSSSPRVTSLLEALPGDAYAKRQMLWQVGAREVHDAMAGLLTAKSLEEMSRTLFSFSIPLNDISSWNHSLNTRTLKLQIGEQNLHYCFKTEEDLAGLVAELTHLDIS